MSSDYSKDPFARLRAEPLPTSGAASPLMPIEYRGTQGPLFRLGLRTALLTLVTLGIYRFWAKTRKRRYFCSATAPGGDPMEYTGNGLEKLLGWLIAVAFLAVYLGLFQLLLFFAGLSLFSGGESQQDQALQLGASQITLIAVLPFIFYAQYRARRYILSRTRWRGVRFGVEAAAWGYVWRALAHSFVTVITLGFLLPRQTFWLEKYKVDRTWYGDTQFEQQGRWQSVYPAMKHNIIAFVIVTTSLALTVWSGQPIWLIFTFVGAVWAYYGLVYYGVVSFRILANQKRLGPHVGFVAEPLASKVFWTTVLGGLLASVCAGLVFTAFSTVASNVLGLGLVDLIGEMESVAELDFSGASGVIGIGLFVLGYLAMLLSYGVFTLIFISQPVLEHLVTTTRITNAVALDDIKQRHRDEMVEAEGFADALDVGAAI
jgi:uncharacterized membrane protein YjgN (DUF898 family)